MLTQLPSQVSLSVSSRQYSYKLPLFAIQLRVGDVTIPVISLVGPLLANGLGSRAELTAAPASTMPLPHRAVVQVLPSGNALAVVCKISST